MGIRPSFNDVAMGTAYLMALRSTCARRQVGCVLVDSQNHVLSTGYNGVAAGLPHCIEKPCPGALCESGTGLELCEAIHAEQNAMLQCRDVGKIYACYSTTLPCITCVKLLLNTSCQVIYFAEDYPHREAVDNLWNAQANRLLIHCSMPNKFVEAVNAFRPSRDQG